MCQPNWVSIGSEIWPGSVRAKARILERLHHHAVGEEAEIAAVLGAARIERLFHRDDFERLAGRELGLDRVSLFLGRNEDVARVHLFLRLEGREVLVVGGAHGLLGHRRGDHVARNRRGGGRGPRGSRGAAGTYRTCRDPGRAAAWAITFMSISTVTRKARRSASGILASSWPRSSAAKVRSPSVIASPPTVATTASLAAAPELRRWIPQAQRGPRRPGQKPAVPAPREARQGPAAASRGQSGCASGARQCST